MIEIWGTILTINPSGQYASSYEHTKATMSIADELSRFVKLKELGVITKEEFLQSEEQSNEEYVNYNP